MPKKTKKNVFKNIIDFLMSYKRLIKFLAGNIYSWAGGEIKKEKKKVLNSIERTKKLKHNRRTKVSKRRLE